MVGPRPLRTVFIDAGPLCERHLTGIGRYTARLALALKALPDCELRFAVGDDEVVPSPSLDWSQDQDLARWAKAVWRGRRVPLAEAGVADDCLGLFCCQRPPVRRFPFEVSVLHDFTPLIVPWTHTPKNVRQFRKFFAGDLLHSDAAVADSKSTKADARWLCDFPPEKIVVAPCGPSLCVERHLHDSAVVRRPAVGLVVSTLEPRKNPFFLLDWFKTTDALPEGSELWWVGPAGWLMPSRKLRSYAKVDARGRRVRFLGKVSDAELCRLYQTAGWSAYPSLYEGFGLPVLDALRHGTPVLASDHSALRELDHPGVHYFDPYDADTVDCAWRSLQDKGPVVAPRMVLDTFHRWDAVARIVLDLPDHLKAKVGLSTMAA